MPTPSPPTPTTTYHWEGEGDGPTIYREIPDGILRSLYREYGRSILQDILNYLLFRHRNLQNIFYKVYIGEVFYYRNFNLFGQFLLNEFRIQ